MGDLFNREEIDGVPVYWVDAPPFQATLWFRVGVADEQYLNRGITHLVEHLALDQFFSAPFTSNGATGYEVTSFTFQGDRGHFGRFVDGLAGYLSAPTFDEFERERKVLRAESTTRDAGVVAYMLFNRYGHRGPGLLADREWGLRWLSPVHAQRWAADHFNRSNLVVMMSGPPPEDLRFRFPAGSRSVLPVVEPAHAGRRLVGGAPGAVAFSSLVPREHGNQAVMMAIREIAIEMVRRRTGHLYDLGVDYFRVDAERAVTSFIAVCDDTEASSVAETVVEIVSMMGERGISRDVHDRIKGRLHFEEPSPGDLARVEMAGAAYYEAVGWEIDPLDERIARAVPSIEQFPELARPFATTLQMRAPEGTGLADRFPALESRVLDLPHSAAWTGGANNAWPGAGSSLSFDEQQVQVSIPDHAPIQIRFDEIVAVVVEKHYEFWLIGADGTELGFWQGDWMAPDTHFWSLLWERIPWNLQVAGLDEPVVPSPPLIRLDRNY